jgi:cation transport regulator ChaB
MTWQPYEHDSDSLDCKCRECLLGVIEQLEAQLRAERQPAPDLPRATPPSKVGDKFLVYNGSTCFLAQALSQLDDLPSIPEPTVTAGAPAPLFETWWDFAEATLATDLKDLARSAFNAGWEAKHTVDLDRQASAKDAHSVDSSAVERESRLLKAAGSNPALHLSIPETGHLDRQNQALYDACCKAVCRGCREGKKYREGSHFHTPPHNPDGEWADCKAEPIRKLAKEAALHTVPTQTADSKQAVRELRELSEKATPGEWRFDQYEGGSRIVTEPDIPINIFRNKCNSEFICACVNYVRAALQVAGAAPAKEGQ